MDCYVLIPRIAAYESESESDDESESEPDDEDYEDSESELSNGMFEFEQPSKPSDNIPNQWFKGNFVNKKLFQTLMEQENSAIKIKPDKMSPIEIFNRFFDEETYQLIIDQSVFYAKSKGNMKFDFKIEELKVFLGILLVSTYNKVSRRRMYWQKRKDSKNEAIISAMSRNRFEEILHYLHFIDNNNLIMDDKFTKIRPFLDVMNKKFLANALFNEIRFDVDESMIPYYGKNHLKQSMRSKPVRFGFKMFCLNQPSGYLVYCDPYQGKGSGHMEFIEFGLSGGIVLYLISKLPVKGIIYMDNFFSSEKLFHEMTRQGFGAVGTFRSNRVRELPQNMSSREPRGSFNCFSKENEVGDLFSVTQVKDNNIVTIGTNIISSSPLKELNRYSKEQKKKISIPFPSILSNYNSFMGGTDKLDQFISNYRVSVRRKKYYMAIFNWLISAAVYNSWIIYKKSDENQLDFLEFTRIISEQLLSYSNRPTIGRPSTSTSSSSGINEMHLIIKISGNSRSRCVYCNSNSRFKCSSKHCNCSLHPDRCFYNFHKEKYKIN